MSLDRVFLLVLKEKNCAADSPENKTAMKMIKNWLVEYSPVDINRPPYLGDLLVFLMNTSCFGPYQKPNAIPRKETEDVRPYQNIVHINVLNAL